MYDLVIIGAGPAGLTASVYTSCFKLNHVIIGALPGGQMTYAPDILNYPGFEEITGPELTSRMVAQVKKRGGELIPSSVTRIEKEEDGFVVFTDNQQSYKSAAIILATGVERRRLGIPGEMEYTGKGVQYCATCERFAYENKIVAVIGGANAAAQSAVQLSHAAAKVFILYRGDALRADPIWLSAIEKNPRIEVVTRVQPTEIVGDGVKVTGVKIRSIQNETDVREIPVEQIFVEIGGVPGTALLLPLGVRVDQGGYIAVGETLATSVEGIFAAGDVLSHKYSIEQISSAVGLGARAAVSVFTYLKQQKAPNLWGTSQIKRS
ncbi:MAG: FAD-dependent oxidoreductase [Candidatus Levybacteria bacterium]|nr:FAD-dependent oxidoreductase [Candidatus Levybacteria bacterium]